MALVRIMALDLSTRVGWAVGVPGERPRYGTWMLPSMADNGRCGAALVAALEDAITVHAPTHIVAEAPLPLPAQNHAATARLQFGLAWTVAMVGYWRDVQTRECSVDKARMGILGRCRFAGHRDEAKRVVMGWCEKQGWPVDDDNMADACLLWRWSCMLAEHPALER